MDRDREHLDDERIQRLLHGELAGAEEELARAHMSRCRECRERLTEEKREDEAAYALLRGVADPVASIDLRAITRRAAERRPRFARWAAGFALAAGIAGAAYALPGSPVRDWMAAFGDWIRGGPAARPASNAPMPDRATAGIATLPGRSLAILFRVPRSEGRLIVSLTDAAEVEVRGPRGAATFTSDADRLIVTDQGTGAAYDVRIARNAPRVEILVNERSVFLKEGPTVSTEAPPGVLGSYTIPLVSEKEDIR